MLVFVSVRYPTLEARGLRLGSTAIRQILKGVLLWLQHSTHQGVLTTHPYALSMPNAQRILKQSRLSHAKEYLMFFVVLALFLLICGGLVVLTVQNLSTPVHLVFYTWHTPAVPVALWIVGAFLLGTLLLYLISVTSA